MQISSTGPIGVSPLSPPPTTAPAEGDNVFGSMFQRMLGSAATQQQQADQGIIDLSLGRTDQMHQVLLDVAKADLQFRMVLEIRNKLIDAYQEVQKMQV